MHNTVQIWSSNAKCFCTFESVGVNSKRAIQLLHDKNERANESVCVSINEKWRSWVVSEEQSYQESSTERCMLEKRKLKSLAMDSAMNSPLPLSSNAWPIRGNVSSSHAVQGVEISANYSDFRSKCLSIWLQRFDNAKFSKHARRTKLYAKQSQFDAFVLRGMQMRNFVYRSLDGSINLQDYFSLPSSKWIFQGLFVQSSSRTSQGHELHNQLAHLLTQWFARSLDTYLGEIRAGHCD